MGSKGEKVIYTLFDSGATFSSISAEKAEEIGMVEKMYHPLVVAAASRGRYVKIENTLAAIFITTTYDLVMNL